MSYYQEMTRFGKLTSVHVEKLTKLGMIKLEDVRWGCSECKLVCSFTGFRRMGTWYRKHVCSEKTRAEANNILSVKNKELETTNLSLKATIKD